MFKEKELQGTSTQLFLCALKQLQQVIYTSNIFTGSQWIMYLEHHFSQDILLPRSGVSALFFPFNLAWDCMLNIFPSGFGPHTGAQSVQIQFLLPHMQSDVIWATWTTQQHEVTYFSPPAPHVLQNSSVWPACSLFLSLQNYRHDETTDVTAKTTSGLIWFGLEEYKFLIESRCYKPWMEFERWGHLEEVLTRGDWNWYSNRSSEIGALSLSHARDWKPAHLGLCCIHSFSAVSCVALRMSVCPLLWSRLKYPSWSSDFPPAPPWG